MTSTNILPLDSPGSSLLISCHVQHLSINYFLFCWSRFWMSLEHTQLTNQLTQFDASWTSDIFQTMHCSMTPYCIGTATVNRSRTLIYVRNPHNAFSWKENIIPIFNLHILSVVWLSLYDPGHGLYCWRRNRIGEAWKSFFFISKLF